MRKRITLAAVGVGLVMSFLPVSNANAVCIYAWYTVTGRCSPCNDANDALGYLNDEYGTPPVALNCLA